jgi:hypothetical protein
MALATRLWLLAYRGANRLLTGVNWLAMPPPLKTATPLVLGRNRPLPRDNDLVLAGLIACPCLLDIRAVAAASWLSPRIGL